jgi:enamine deaminase RidA (YjgF/YER057c/UK114 family)
MFKKFISMTTAVLLMVCGLSVITTSPASAFDFPVGTNIALGSTQPATGGTASTLVVSWTVPSQGRFISTTWSPALTAGKFAANTIYSAIVTVGPVAGVSRFGSINANTFTVSQGAAVGTTVTHDAITANASSAVITITFPMTVPVVGPVITSTSTLTVGQVNPTIAISRNTGNLEPDPSSFNLGGFINMGLSSPVFTSTGSRSMNVSFTGTVTAGTLTFQVKEDLNNSTPASNTLSFVVGGGSTPAPTLTAAEIVAAAAAAAAARAAEAAAIRAAEIATAQTALATVLRGDKAGSLSEYRAANINITTTAALTRLNAEVLKLPAADRADFAKIKAIADKIEFDESFFNATARPSLATYSSYGITGVTERILPVINAKVLELPAALRADVKAMQELVKVESFVDRVANPATRSTVSAAVLVSRGLLTAEYPRRHSIVNGLARYPEGSLNTMAKIEAAIKEQIFIAEAPKRRLAEIKARMAARKK